MHNKDPVNWEENSEIGVVRLHNFNSRFLIHGKFLVPKNVNWEVALYLYFLQKNVATSLLDLQPYLDGDMQALMK